MTRPNPTRSMKTIAKRMGTDAYITPNRTRQQGSAGLDRALVVVDHDRRVEIGDLGLGAVALGDHLAPGSVVGLLGRRPALPQIDAAADRRPAPFAGAIEIVLAHQ